MRDEIMRLADQIDALVNPNLSRGVVAGAALWWERLWIEES